MLRTDPDQAERVKLLRGKTVFSRLRLNTIDFFLLAQEFATGQSGIAIRRLIESVPSLHWHSADMVELLSLLLYCICNNNGIFQHDNARPHTARHTQDILHIHKVIVLQWPARSRDRSPIEHF